MDSRHSKKISMLFERLVDMDEPQREAALLEVGLEAAVIDEVRRLLGAQAQLPPQFLQPTVAEPEAAAIPTSLGPYRIVELLGSGGMGEVYRAEQQHPIRRTVAIKLIRPGLNSAEILSRFQAEQRVLALLDHPNIARVIDASDAGANRPYFVLEYVPGTPIAQYCDDHRLSVTERLTLFRQVCDAIAYAHTKGIIHRDIKSSNVLVLRHSDDANDATTNRSGPVVKVIDFGIAKAIAEVADDPWTSVTSAGSPLGTYEYMSPEQASGSADIDTRADVYSLGILLYELLVGTRPFDTRRLGRMADGELRRVIREDQPPRPSTRFSETSEETTRLAEARGVRPDRLRAVLQSELEWIPLKALRKERERRYQSVTELSRDIENYLNARPLIAGPESRWYRVRKWQARNRVLIVAAVLGLAAIVGATLLHVQRLRAEQRRTQVALDQANAVNAFLRDMLSSVDPERARGKPVLVTDLLDAAAPDVSRRFAAQPAIESALRLTIGRTYLAIGQPDSALRQLQPAAKSDAVEPRAALELELARIESLIALDRTRETEAAATSAVQQATAALGAVDPLTLRLQSRLGALQQLNGHFRESEATLTTCLAQQRARGDAGDVEDTLVTYARTVMSLGRHLDAVTLFHDCWESSQKAFGADHPRTIRVATEYGDALNAVGRYADAEAVLKPNIALADRVLGAAHLDTLAALNNYANTLSSLDRRAEAEPLYAKILEQNRERLGDDHRNSLQFQMNRATILHEMGRGAEAEPLIRHVYERRRAVLGDDHPDTISAGSVAGWTLVAVGKREEGERLLREILPRVRATLGPDHPLAMDVENSLAMALAPQARFAEAEAIYKSLIERFERMPNAAVVERIGVYNNYGTMLMELGRGEESLKMQLRALEGRTQIFGPNHSHVFRSYNQVALALRTLKRYDEAQVYARRAWDGCSRTLGESHPMTLNALNTYAITLDEAGNPADSEKHHRLALEGRTRLMGPNDAGTLNSMINLGSLLSRNGRPQEGLPYLQHALTEFGKQFGHDHPGTVRIANRLAMTLDQVGRHDEAESMRREYHVPPPPSTLPTTSPSTAPPSTKPVR